MGIGEPTCLCIHKVSLNTQPTAHTSLPYLTFSSKLFELILFLEAMTGIRTVVTTSTLPIALALGSALITHLQSQYTPHKLLSAMIFDNHLYEKNHLAVLG
jgi:hypothetical protein